MPASTNNKINMVVWQADICLFQNKVTTQPDKACVQCYIYMRWWLHGAADETSLYPIGSTGM